MKGRLTEAGDTAALPPDPRPGARLRDLAGSKWTNKGHVCSQCWKGSPFCAHSLPCSWQLQDLVLALRLTFRTLTCGCSLPLQLHPTQTGGAPSQGLCASLPGMPFPSPSPLYLEHPPSKSHLSLSQGAPRLPEPPLSISFPGHGNSLQARESLTHLTIVCRDY